MLSTERVRARTHGVLAQRADDELVLYDAVADRAHLLSPVATAVWGHIQTPIEVADLCVALTDAHDEVSIRLALDELRSADLLDSPPVESVLLGGMSRRALLRRVGIAAIAAPFVTTIFTASPAAAVPNAICSASIPCGAGETCDGNPGRCYRSCTGNGNCNDVTGCTCEGPVGAKRCRLGSTTAVYC